MTAEARKKYTSETKARNQTGGGPSTIESRSACVQEMMEICGKHYFEGDDVKEGGEVSFFFFIVPIV
jgi:hypothetical protein